MKNRNMPAFRFTGTVAALAATLILAGCASAPPTNAALDAARSAYTQASTDATVVRSAPVELRAAQKALQEAETALSTGADVSDVNFYSSLASKRTLVAVETGKLAMAEKAATDAAAARDQIVLASRTKQVDTAMASASKANQRASQLEAELAAMNAKKTDRGMVLTLGDVLFDTGRAELQPGAASTLDQLARFMTENTDRTLKIEGYTDSVGSDQTNQVLSERRAIAVKNALIDRGLDSSRMSARGFGESTPVASNSTPSGRQLNRRVEIVISDKS